MKITLKGEMTLAEMRQALFEMLHSVEEDYAVRYSRGATLYLNPTNGFGDKIVARNKIGEEVTKLHSKGPCRSAADEYRI